MGEPVQVSTMPALVALLRKARLDRGLSQQKVADRLGVHHTAVSNWECLRAKPSSAGVLIAWARVVGIGLWAVPEGKEIGS